MNKKKNYIVHSTDFYVKFISKQVFEQCLLFISLLILIVLECHCVFNSG